MKIVFLLIGFLGLFCTGRSQCVITVDTNITVISQDTTLNFSTAGGPSQTILVCENVNLYITGFSTWLFRIYQLQGSTVEMDDTMNFYFFGDVYLDSSATFDFNHKMGSYLDTVIHEPSSALVDTNYSPNGTFIVCPDLVFDFSLWPNGQSPCSGATGLALTPAGRSVHVYPNPSDGNFMVEFPAEMMRESFSISSLEGKIVFRGTVENCRLAFSSAEFKPGIYILTAESSSPLKLVVQ